MIENISDDSGSSIEEERNCNLSDIDLQESSR